MLFRKMCLLPLLCFCIHQLIAQTRAVEITFVHTQTTLPWKKLPAGNWHPGVSLSWLAKKNARTRWIKDWRVGYLYHPHLFHMVSAGFGYRYEMLPTKHQFQLQGGFNVGPLLQKATETIFENNRGDWKNTRPPLQLKGSAALMLRAGYRPRVLPQLMVAAGINIWVHAPYVAQFSTILPHRNYEIALQYNLDNKKR